MGYTIPVPLTRRQPQKRKLRNVRSEQQPNGQRIPVAQRHPEALPRQGPSVPLRSGVGADAHQLLQRGDEGDRGCRQHGRGHGQGAAIGEAGTHRPRRHRSSDEVR